jgi:hypothetical protein
VLEFVVELPQREKVLATKRHAVYDLEAVVHLEFAHIQQRLHQRDEQSVRRIRLKVNENGLDLFEGIKVNDAREAGVVRARLLVGDRERKRFDTRLVDNVNQVEDVVVDGERVEFFELFEGVDAKGFDGELLFGIEAKVVEVESLDHIGLEHVVFFYFLEVFHRQKFAFREVANFLGKEQIVKGRLNEVSRHVLSLYGYEKVDEFICVEVFD